MRQLLFVMILASSLFTVLAADAAELEEPTAPGAAWYRAHYPFCTISDTVYTFQSEFILPEGFHHADSSRLNDFQVWISNFPLRHRYIRVGSWKGRIKYEVDQVSRAVHLPYSGQLFRDYTLPLRVLAEYLLYREQQYSLTIVPARGDTLRYGDWLMGELVYNSHREPFFRPGAPREPSQREYYDFMKACMRNTSYASLAFNADSIKADQVMPGDVFVAHDERGLKGCVYLVLHMIENKDGKKLYAVATGCPDACDIHIPLLTENRDMPWVTVDNIAALGRDYPRRSFLRLLTGP